MTYKKEYGGFEKIIEKKMILGDYYEMVVAYKREIPATKLVVKTYILTNKNKNSYTVSCSIRREDHTELGNVSFEETVKTEEEAKEIMFAWIDEHKLKLVVEPTKYI